MPAFPNPLRCAPLIALVLAGCTTVGPDFEKPQTTAPADWSSWRSGDPSLHAAPVANEAVLLADWWSAFNDPVLDELQNRAVSGSPDLRTAALHVAQARIQRGVTQAQELPQVNLGANVTRQRQSENGASTRMLDIMSGSVTDSDALAKLLAEPFTLFQGGLDMSWEPDLWGRVRRSLESADADLAEQAALLDYARLTLVSDVTRTYFELRATQSKIAITREDIASLEQGAQIVSAQVSRGAGTHLDLDRQKGELQALQASLPTLLTQEAAQTNQLALLLGERPGALADILALTGVSTTPSLPDLALGLPSEVALRRPDVRAAEARLHSATAKIGVATADLYPSIRLGGGFNLESYKSGSLFDWASRTWSLGPIIDLPLFDGGRRKRVVQLREMEQREAAVAYQTTVLGAWHEIDDALTGYTAERKRNEILRMRVATASDALKLASSRYQRGATDFLGVIDAHRTLLQATRDLTDSNALIAVRYATINKALGNVPAITEDRYEAPLTQR